MGGLAPLGIVDADRLDGIGTDLVKVSRGAGREAAQIKTGHPLTLEIGTGRGLDAGLIAIIKNLVHLNSCAIEPRIGFLTNLQTKRARDRDRHERIISAN